MFYNIPTSIILCKLFYIIQKRETCKICFTISQVLSCVNYFKVYRKDKLVKKKLLYSIPKIVILSNLFTLYRKHKLVKINSIPTSITLSKVFYNIQ